MIAVEDERFALHCGVDPVSILRALLADLRAGGFVEGGSTITQQLAKNELFTQEKRMARKAAELFAARDLESYYSKQQIFEMYAGTIYFGSGYYGVAEAARGYFDNEPAQLTAAECVVLAGLPQAPSQYDPTTRPALALKRAETVIERMESCKKLTHTQALELADQVEALPLLAGAAG